MQKTSFSSAGEPLSANMSSALYRVVENGAKVEEGAGFDVLKTYSPIPTRDGVTTLGNVDQQSYILTPVMSPNPAGYQTFVYAAPQQDLRSPFLNATWGSDVGSQGTLKRVVLLAPPQESHYSTLHGINNVTSQAVIQNVQSIQNVEQRSPTPDKLPSFKGTNISLEKQTIIEQNSTNKSEVTSPTQDKSPIYKSVSWGSQTIIEQNSTNKSELTSPTQLKSAADFSSDNAEKLDPRYFGELLAELNRKSTDTYNFLYSHVEKIHAHKPSESDDQDVESLIPKGISELTKQQIRYLLQMRITAEKSQRLLLATFSSLREELSHLEQDLRRLDSEKESLQRDLNFKDQQAKQYEKLLEAVRENNRQLQDTIREGGSNNRKLEEMILSMKNQESDKDYQIKELEYGKRVLEKENESLRLQLSGQGSSPSFQNKADEISRHYKDMIDKLREEKEREITTLRSEISRIQRDASTKEGSSSSMQLKVMDLSSVLQEKETLIKQQKEEILRLQQAKESGSNSSRTIITKTYSNQYPILGLLNDYKPPPPVQREHQYVIERTEKW
ncbi:protein POF1B [Protopterus annectens]|uniref:protein POF1B n=1 Tax=Protopterus annectens TaxID=7888 RepID=UPI001CFAE596|nr:protein POF1B [Protopterus annectens]